MKKWKFHAKGLWVCKLVHGSPMGIKTCGKGACIAQ